MRLGAVCEVLLIIANIGTAVVVYPDLQAAVRSPLSGYVTARLAECTFIAIGIVSYLAVVTLHQTTAGVAGGSLLNDARSLVAVRNWTFVLGPGFVVGVGNGFDPWLPDVPVRPYAARLGDVGADRRSSHLHFGARGGGRRIRQRRPGADHRDNPGVLLGAVARDLSHRQGVQAISNPRGRAADLPGERGSLSLTMALGQSPGGVLAPSVVALLGRWNWRLPRRSARVLPIAPRPMPAA